MKHLEQWRKDNKGEWGHHYHFIWQCTSISTEAKIVLQFMLNEFDMNGHIRWTRQKYSELSGTSYRTVRRLFEALQQQNILTPVKGTTNYDLAFRLLEIAAKSNKLTGLPVKKTGLAGNETGLAGNETGLADTKIGPGGLHIDNKDLIENKDLYMGEGESFMDSPSQTQERIKQLVSQIHASEPKRAVKKKIDITEEDLDDFLNDLDI